MVLSTVYLVMLVAGADVVPAISDIPRDDSFTSLNTETIICPESSLKRTTAKTYEQILYLDRKRLNVNVDAIYEPAKPLSFPNVSYPFADWKAGIEGFVSVAVVVDKNGSVENIEVVCATNERFQAEALKAAMKMRYQPAMWHGRAVPDIAIQPFKFYLD